MVRKVLDDSAVSVTAEQMDRLQELRRKQGAGLDLSEAESQQLQLLDELYQEVRAQYQQSVGGDLSLEHLTEVLRAPERNILEESPLRADVLMKEFREASGFSDWERAGKELMFINNELASLDGPHGGRDLIARLSEDDGTLARQLFGTEEIPREVLLYVSTYRYLDAGVVFEFPEGEARRVLRTHIEGHAQRVHAFQEASYRQYMSGIHETEAYVIDRLALGEVERVQGLRAGSADEIDIPIYLDGEWGGAGEHGLNAPTFEMNGQQYVVVGGDGPYLMAHRASDRLPLGEPVPVSDGDLSANYTEVNGSGYYRDNLTGEYYLLRESADGRWELVLDPNVEPIAV
jgi:hypothetical protein